MKITCKINDNIEKMLHVVSHRFICKYLVPNLDLLGKFFRDPVIDEGFFPMDTIILVGPNPIEFMHDESGPLPSTPRLDPISKILLNRVAGVRKTKIHIKRRQSDAYSIPLKSSHMKGRQTKSSGGHQFEKVEQFCVTR